MQCRDLRRHRSAFFPTHGDVHGLGGLAVAGRAWGSEGCGCAGGSGGPPQGLGRWRLRLRCHGNDRGQGTNWPSQPRSRLRQRRKRSVPWGSHAGTTRRGRGGAAFQGTGVAGTKDSIYVEDDENLAHKLPIQRPPTICINTATVPRSRESEPDVCWAAAGLKQPARERWRERATNGSLVPKPYPRSEATVRCQAEVACDGGQTAASLGSLGNQGAPLLRLSHVPQVPSCSARRHVLFMSDRQF